MNRFDELMFLVEKTSKKEQHRIDKFLKQHKYDPKTGTIETDEVGKDGKKLRVKFNITNGPVFSDHMTQGPYSKDSFTINMPRKSLKRKPMVSNQLLKHEEGHIAYKRNPEKYAELYDKAKKAIDDDKNDKDDHGKNPEEYIADWYSAKHSRYGLKGFNKMINCMKSSDKDIKDAIKNIENRCRKNKDLTTDDIRRLEREIREIKEKIRDYKERIPINEKELSKMKSTFSKLKESNTDREELSDYKYSLDNLEYTVQYQKKAIKEYPQKIKELEKNISNSRDDLRSKKDTERMLKYYSPSIQRSVKDAGNLNNNEMNLRQKFVNDNIKESTDVLLDIYEAEYNGDITSEERDILVNYLYEKY